MIAITPNVNITKKDEFMIAETEETFSNGGKYILSSNNMLPWI